ncbi:MAG: tetratricopeptide repeat protein [Chloroflexi bacterium]|nr:tetratricopeptide repeat protein [Chloroflexota bacterium]MCI0730867.1 tetratricopeptide repeat protein [Chloroflexota bacterium]
MVKLALTFFGTFQAHINGRPLTHFRSAKVQALLAYLAIEVDQPHSRDSLAALLWPDKPDVVARQNLRQSLHQLRDILEDDNPSRPDQAPFLLVTRQTVAFNPDSNYQLDVAQFLGALNRGELARAVALYRGELLTGLYCDSITFEEWQAVTRERMHRLALDALRELARERQEHGDYLQARQYLERQLALEPWEEAAHRELMWVLARNGQRAAALAQFDACRQVLAQELGVAPTAETMALYEQIRAGRLESRAVEGQQRGRETAAAPLPNLPVQTTPLVGRERELTELAQLLADPTCRLLTLVGPGGVGKTRLAVSAAQAQMGGDSFSDGIYFISLVGLPGRPGASGELENEIAATTGAALGVPFSGSEPPLRQLLDRLRPKRVLLVMDNWEHVLDGAGVIAELLAGVQGIKVLATSREPLNLHGEWLYRVEGLALPGSEEGEDLDSFSAVRLFVQSARRARADFRLHPGNQDAVGRICRLVNGLPLAIELATTWLRGLTCAELAEEIGRGLELFTSPLRNALERHRSMRVVFEHSWELLSAQEQRILAELSVFRGGFNREAARAVVGASVLDLTTLVAKSLLAHHGQMPYEMHELLRQFATEKLSLTDRASLAQGQHSAYYLDLLVSCAPGLTRREVATVTGQIQQEMDNIRQAWRWATETGQLDLLERSHRAVSHFYHHFGLYREAEVSFGRAIERAREQLLPNDPYDSVPRRLLGRLVAQQARILVTLSRYHAAIDAAKEAIELGKATSEIATEGQGYLAWGLAELELMQDQDALVHLRRALELVAEVGMVDLDAATRAKLAVALLRQGQIEEAGNQLEKALQACRETGNDRAAGNVLKALGNAAMMQGQYERARDYYEQGLRAVRDISYRSGEAAILGDLGNLEDVQGHYASAQRSYEEALRAFRESGSRKNESLALADLADLACKQGDLVAARAHAERSWKLCQEMDDPVGESKALTTLARISRYEGRLPDALQNAEQAIRLARARDSHFIQAIGLTELGRALLVSIKSEDLNPGLLAQAVDAFQEAYRLRQELSQHDLAMESLAGVAEAVFLAGDVTGAQECVMEILDHLGGRSFLQAYEPLQVWLTCYRILHASQDPRANDILRSAHALLGERTAEIA